MHLFPWPPPHPRYILSAWACQVRHNRSKSHSEKLQVRQGWRSQEQSPLRRRAEPSISERARRATIWVGIAVLSFSSRWDPLQSLILSGSLPHTWRLEMLWSALALSRAVSKRKWAKGCGHLKTRKCSVHTGGYHQGHLSRWAVIPAPTLSQPHLLWAVPTLSSLASLLSFSAPAIQPPPSSQNTFPKISISCSHSSLNTSPWSLPWSEDPEEPAQPSFPTPLPLSSTWGS